MWGEQAQGREHMGRNAGGGEGSRVGEEEWSGGMEEWRKGKRRGERWEGEPGEERSGRAEERRSERIEGGEWRRKG